MPSTGSPLVARTYAARWRLASARRPKMSPFNRLGVGGQRRGVERHLDYCARLRVSNAMSPS